MTNERLVFDRGNQWIKDVDVAPYYAIPVWWRRFIYRVLSAREFCVYTYLCGVFDRNGVAYPTVAQIADDLGIKSSIVVSRALRRLAALGFILRGDRSIKGRLLSRRLVYQRPLAAHTLKTLLAQGAIDHRLFPSKSSAPAKKSDFTDRAVELGLRRVLGDDLFHAYELAPEARRADLLALALDQRVDFARSMSRQRAAQKLDVPDNVSALLHDEMEIPF